jgi:plastocyanin
MKARRFLKPTPLLVAGLALAVLALAAGCGSKKGGSTYGNTTTPTATPTSTATPTPTMTSNGAAVKIANFAFDPATLTIKSGVTVTWTNNDSVTHTVTSTDRDGVGANTTSLFDSSLNPGASFSYTFTKTGTYFYECTIHASMPSMHAKVIVQ